MALNLKKFDTPIVFSFAMTLVLVPGIVLAFYLFNRLGVAPLGVSQAA